MAVTDSQSNSESNEKLNSQTASRPTPRAKRSSFGRFIKGFSVFCLVTFSMIGYQNCMGQKVDLLSTTPGASEGVACAPTTSDLSDFTSAATDVQNNCVVCHGDTSNTASSVLRFYTSAADASATSDNLCAIQSRTTATVLAKITGNHPIVFTDSTAPNLLAYLRSH